MSHRESGREDLHIAGWAEQLRLERQRQAAAAGQPKGWLATFLVLVAMAGIVGTGAVAAEATEGLPQQPIEVTSGVLITPADGWEFVGRSDDGESILLTRGSGNLGVRVVPGTEPPEEVLLGVLAAWTAESGTSITVGPIRSVGIREQNADARAAYAGTFAALNTPVEGELTVVAGSDVAVVFDGWAGIGQYPSVRAEVDEMIRTATIP